MTWGLVNNGRIFIFGWTFPFWLLMKLHLYFKECRWSTNILVASGVEGRYENSSGSKYLLKGKEEATGHQNENHGKVEDPGLLGHHDPPVAVKPVSARKNLPFPFALPLLAVRGVHGWGVVCADLVVLALTDGLLNPKMHVSCHLHTSNKTKL